MNDSETPAGWPPTLHGARASLGRDLIAGLTLAAIALPSSLAAAQLVGVSPALGLLAFILGAVVFTLVGGHRTLSVGPDSSIAPLLAAGAAGSVLGGDPGPVDPGSLLLVSLLVGAFLILLGLVRGGWITQFLSRPVTVGLLAGIGLSIITSQLHAVLGINEPTQGTVPVQILDIADSVDEINLWAVGLAALVLAISVTAALVNPRLPGALLGLTSAAVLAAALDLGDRGVATLQAAESVWRLPDYAGLDWTRIPDLLPGALVIVVLVTVQTGATEAATGQGQRTLDRDLGAIGVASVVSAGAGAFAVNASPPRTQLIRDARGRTQLVSLSAAVVVLLVLLFGTGLLPLLPSAALAAILLQIAFSLIDFGELRRIARYSRMELAVALGTTVLVVVLGIIPGVALAALVTLLDRTRREARPPVYRKGLIPQSNHWVPVDAGVDTVQVPKVLVWSVEAPIWYADSDFVIEQLHRQLDDGDYEVVVLDAAAISDLDYTGILALGTLIETMEQEDIPVLIARATRPTRSALDRAGLSAKVRLFPTVSDAVKAGAETAGLEDEFRAARGKKKDLARLAEDGLEREELLEATAETAEPEPNRHREQEPDS